MTSRTPIQLAQHLVLAVLVAFAAVWGFGQPGEVAWEDATALWSAESGTHSSDGSAAKTIAVSPDRSSSAQFNTPTPDLEREDASLESEAEELSSTVPLTGTCNSTDVHWVPSATVYAITSATAWSPPVVPTSNPRAPPCA